MKWEIEQEEYYFKIYADKELIGFFQPDYGKIYPKEKEEEIIERMLKSEEQIHEGLLYIPMMKLNLDSDMDYELDKLQAILEVSLERTKEWARSISMIDDIKGAWVRRSHTDHDMLALLLNIKFPEPVRLSKRELLGAIEPVMKKFIEDRLL